MYFKNETSEIEIFVDGYTDFPEAYSEQIGKNALSCTVAYSLKRAFGNGVLFDELFQTNDIIILHEKIAQLLAGKVETIEYEDKWGYFTFNAKKSENNFEVYINILNRSSKDDINGFFKMTFNELQELKNELQGYMAKFPVID